MVFHRVRNVYLPGADWVSACALGRRNVYLPVAELASSFGWGGSPMVLVGRTLREVNRGHVGLLGLCVWVRGGVHMFLNGGGATAVLFYNGIVENVIAVDGCVTSCSRVEFIIRYLNQDAGRCV